MKDRNKTKKQLIKKSEQKFRESEERFRALTENTSDWIWEVDQSFVFTYSSPKVKDLLGYEPHEVIGKTPFDFMPKHEARHVSEIAHSIMASQKPFTSEENINLHKDGRLVIIETGGVPIFDKDGNFSGYRGINRDITRRKRAEEALQENEVRLRKLSDNLPNGLVYQIDTGEDGQQRRFSYISAGVEQLHGITATEALSNAMSIYGQVIAEDRLRLSEEEAFAIANMVPFRSEARLKLPSGEIRWRLFASAPRRLPNNHLIWDGVEIDITVRKRAEAELEIKAKNLEEANIALKVLLKKMDEDKIELEEKVLLNVKEMILPYLEKLKMSGLDESQKTFVGILESSLTQIISPFSLRMSSKFFNFTPKEIQVANLLRQGKTNKEIGELLNSSPRTIACHRENIRKKLGLKNKKANLKSYLLSVK